MLRRPALWLAAGAACSVVLLALAISSQLDWHHRATRLERENLSLQLAQLAQEITDEAEPLIEHARDLAQSELVAQLLQGDAAAAADHSAFTSPAHAALDAVFLTTASQAVRFSATMDGDRLVERPPTPAMMRFLASAAIRATAPGTSRKLEHDTPSAPAENTARGTADSAFRVPMFLEFTGGRWIVARAILARAAPATILGWLVVARPASAHVVAQLARSAISGAGIVNITGGINVSGGFNVSTRPAPDYASGYVLLRDAAGNPAWAVHFTPSMDFSAAGLAQPQSQSAAGTGKGHRIKYVLAALLVLLVIVIIVVVALRRYVRHQKSVDARYKALIDQANDGIVIVDAESHQVLYSNPAFLSSLGCTGDEARALTLPDIFADGGATADSVLARLRDVHSQMAMNMQLKCKNGAFLDIEVRCNALDVDGRDVLAYVTHDVSLRKKAEQQLIENQQRLDRMAHHDQLTGLPNRHYLSTFLPNAIAEAQAASTMLGVVFLDLDRFKHINDTRGHETGDKLLQEVAGRLRACVRDTDVVIRMGGDEFVVVFRDVKSYDEVTQGANRIIETLNEPIVIDQHPLQTTGSVGVSLFPRDGSSMVELLKHSDTAMYQAKDRGRNNVQMFSQVMNRKLKHRVTVEASLREALRLKQLDVHYQPFVNLLTRKIVGLEALMRWRHPVHGMIPADQFIPVAEETGLIVPMGNFVLHRTLQTMSAWRNAGVPLVPISLNVAPAQLQRGELQSTISTLLKTHGLRPEMLQLEMTERAVFDSQTPAGENRQDTMARLRDLGIKIAIDDFGTGYSSLSYLKNWRVDALKIDRSFVRDLVTDSSDLAIVSAIIAIARHLHIQVIAEGIEGYQQAEILRRLGCTIGQGFLFARPMPAEQCRELLGDSAEAPKEEDEDMLAVFSAGRG